MPSARYLLSWDAGSGSYRCLIVDAAGRQVALTRGQASVFRAEDVPGSLEFEPQQVWDTFVELTREALASARVEDIAAISVTRYCVVFDYLRCADQS